MTRIRRRITIRMIETMTHDEAIKNGATERYVLDEMTDEEREAFEEHYFDCAVCAEDVRAATAIRDGLAAERVTAEPAVVPLQPRRRVMPAWLAAAASLAISIPTLWFGWVTPLQTRLAYAQQPSVGVEEVILRATRGETKVVSSSSASKLSVAVPPDHTAASGKYRFVIVDAAGHAQPVRGDVVPHPEGQMVPLTIVPGSLKPGSYSVRVDGIQPPLPPCPFTVR